MGSKPILAWLDRAGARLYSESGWWPSAGLLSLFWVIFALPWLFGGQVIPWDAKDFYYPVLRALAAALHAGESGFWNPWLRSGAAVAADPQSWIFTPSFRLLATLFAAPSMRLVDAVQLSHLLAAGLGTLALGRAMGQKPFGALIAAIVIMLGGAAASRLQHTMMTVSYAYLPWAILLLYRAFTASSAWRRRLAALAFGLVAGFMAADRDQVAYLNCLFLVMAALWWAFRSLRRGGPAAAIRHLGEFLPGILLGAVIVAIPAILTLDMLAETTRSALDFETTGRASLQPASLLTLIAPDFFGNLDSAGYWGPGMAPWLEFSEKGIINDPTTSYIYFGLVPLALLGLALAARDLRTRVFAFAEARLFALGLVFAVLYALGAFTPAFRLLYDLLPGVDLYRRPNDAVFLLNAMVAVLAGFAGSALVAGEFFHRPKVSPLAAAVGALCILAMVIAALWLADRLGHLREGAILLAVAIALLAAAFLLMMRRPVAAGSGLWAAAIVALAAADLIARHSGAQFNARPDSFIAAYRPEGASLAAEIKKQLADTGGQYRAEIFGLDRTPGGDGGGSWQNAALAYGIEQTLGYDAILTAEYASNIGAQQNSNEPNRRLTKLFTGYDSSLARLLGIRLVVTGRPIEAILPQSACKGLKLLEVREGAYIYANAGALPRAMIVPRAVTDSGGPLPDDPRRFVMVTGLAADEPEAPGDEMPGNAKLLKHGSDAVSIEVEMTREGWVVLNDRFHPAWRASVDGVDTPVRRANRMFRALRVAAGHHRIEFEFAPLRPDRLWRIAAGKRGAQS